MHKTYSKLKGFSTCFFRGIVEEYSSHSGTNYIFHPGYGDGNNCGNGAGGNILLSSFDMGDGSLHGDSNGNSGFQYNEHFLSFED
jgi:hypothetical protein